MNLSAHFLLSEFVRSDTAIRNGWDNTPPIDALRMLDRLANEVLEPIRAAVGRPVRINSGYRSPILNQAIGGAANSAHMRGAAADFTVPGLALEDYAELVKIACGELPVGKLIQEFAPTGWLHVQIEPLGVIPRREWWVAERTSDGTIYREWV